MIDFNLAEKLYLFTGMSGGQMTLSRLTSIIQHSQKFDRERTSAYLLTNKARMSLRIIYWDSCQFFDMTLKLPSGRMKWPNGDIELLEITLHQLKRLLSGDTLDQSITWSIVG